jgi:hypothetical protein
MTDQTKLLVVHGACVLVIAALFAVAYTVFRGQTIPAGLLVGLGFWLWGKLGFKPAQVVLERIVFKQLGVSLDDAKVLTTRPPAAVDAPEVSS